MTARSGHQVSCEWHRSVSLVAQLLDGAGEHGDEAFASMLERTLSATTDPRNVGVELGRGRAEQFGHQGVVPRVNSGVRLELVCGAQQRRPQRADSSPEVMRVRQIQVH